ncbi:MAG: right-handed parallel beta-helix repeat-containing protein [Candidatus Omnitrophica bacterium]|nr:right-handed parallel beta-helix repeat-containing protein [Candidatus Omnitrophota bacterium]
MKFYVSKNGNDSWSGRLSKPDKNFTDGPFLTLQRAIDEIKKQKQFPVTIEIMQGTYQIFNKIPVDSCRNVLIKGKNVIFTGGQQIRKWEKVKDPSILARLNENVRNHVFKANLKEIGISDFGSFHQPSWAVSTGSQMQLYFNGKPMQIARWPEEGFAFVGEIAGKGKFFCDAGREKIEKWSKEKSLKAYGYWFYEWAAQHMEIESVDPESCIISIKNPDSHSYGYKKGAMYFIYNALSEITRSGEWYLDKETGDIYFYPPTEIEKGEATISVNSQPIIEIKNSEKIKIENIVFENSRKEGIIVYDSQDVTIENCTFRNLGCWAIRAENVKNSKIQDCEIYNIGEGGIHLEGGDRKTLESGNNLIANNHIHDFSLWIKIYRPAVQIDGVGNKVTNNLIHDAPHMAIGWSGNENIIEFNEIYNVVLETNDAGAIYSGRDPSMQGNIIRYNYFHDIGKIQGHGVASVYLDDGHCGNIVYGNIFYRGSKPGKSNFGAVYIHGGRYNLIENNIFLECEQAYNESPWNQELWHQFWTKPPYNQNLFGEIDVRKEPYLSKYPWLKNILEDTRPNILARNIVYKCRRFVDRGQPELIDNLVEIDPVFESCEPPMLKLKKNSPAFRIGFNQIPVESIGLKRK